MKRLFIVLSIVITLLSGCRGRSLKDIKVNSLEIVSLSPHGFRDIDAVVRLTVYNPSVGFELTDILGQLKYKGEEAIIITADQVMVAGKAEKTYTIPLHGTIADDFSPFRLLSLMKGGGGEKNINLDDVTLDISLRPTLRGGIGTTVVKKDIRVSDFLDIQ